MPAPKIMFNPIVTSDNRLNSDLSGESPHHAPWLRATGVNGLQMSALALFAFLSSTVLFGQTYSVTNTNDDANEGSLRWAITSANASSTINSIVFDSGVSGTITLASDLPGITDDLTITGPGAAALTISGNSAYAMFSVSSGKTLTLSGLTFTENKSGNGSIIYLNNSHAVGSSITVTANTNSSVFFSANHSTLTFSDSTFSGNSATIFKSDWGSTPSNTSDTETLLNPCTVVLEGK